MSKKQILLILLAIAVFASVVIYKFKSESFREESEASVPVVPTYPDVVVAGEGQTPEGFPFGTPVFPDSILINATVDDSSHKGEWQVRQELQVVVAWYMAYLYDAGWYMTELPEDPRNVNLQTFTAKHPGGWEYNFTGTSNEKGTHLFVEIID